jgi:hypothetical protein
MAYALDSVKTSRPFTTEGRLFRSTVLGFSVQPTPLSEDSWAGVA